MMKARIHFLTASAICAAAFAATAAERYPVQGPLSEGDILLPIQQRVTPAGKQIVLAKQRPQGVAWHPGGKYFVASGSTAELLVIDPEKAEIIKRVPMPDGKETSPAQASDHILAKDAKAQLSFHGLIFSPKGDRIYLSNVNGDIKVFRADPNGNVAALFSIKLDEVKGLDRKQEIPAGLAVSADGSKLFAALNLSDRLAEIDAASGKILRIIGVGVAPFDVTLAGNKAYVSCWGGRRPGAGDATGAAGRGTKIKVDERGVASEGSVSVVDLATGKVVKEILAGLHPSALAPSPDRSFVCVANADSDSVSVIDTTRDEVVQTTPLNWQPRGYFGASPDALCFSRDGKFLFVCNGTQNAVAAVEFDPKSANLAGLLPVGWYPGDIAVSPVSGAIAVANIKGIGSGGYGKLNGKKSFNSHEHAGSITILPPLRRDELAKMTKLALANDRDEIMEAAALPPREGQPPRAVPERAGEPSPISHVIYIIKENRTYDQVLGDMPEGNGDKSLCTFGEKITPNQHKLCRDFVLLDNLYCCSVLSADGHQWATTAFATDYVERQFAGWPRSYPDLCGSEGLDALAYSPRGFIWDAVIAAGLTVRNFGECSTFNRSKWAEPARKEKLHWADHIANWEKNGHEILYETGGGTPALAIRSCTNTVGWETSIPDVVRAERFLEEFREWEKTSVMPNFCIMALPADHTFGTSPEKPTPAATVADNDLAVARIVAAVSHSRFWTNTAIFAVEDDPQNGWDHVSAYRTTAYIAGAHVRRGAVVHEFYSQNSILRTIELILGLKPMTQLDAIAMPMTACFQDIADLRPFESVANNIPLSQLNKKTTDIKDRTLRRDAVASTRLDFSQPDKCPEDTLNKILWHAMKGPETPYPTWAALPSGSRDLDD